MSRATVASPRSTCTCRWSAAARDGYHELRTLFQTIDAARSARGRAGRPGSAPGGRGRRPAGRRAQPGAPRRGRASSSAGRRTGGRASCGCASGCRSAAVWAAAAATPRPCSWRCAISSASRRAPRICGRWPASWAPTCRTSWSAARRWASAAATRWCRSRTCPSGRSGSRCRRWRSRPAEIFAALPDAAERRSGRRRSSRWRPASGRPGTGRRRRMERLARACAGEDLAVFAGYMIRARREGGARWVRLSGSGGCLVARFDDPAQAEAVARSLPEGTRLERTRTLEPRLGRRPAVRVIDSRESRNGDHRSQSLPGPGREAQGFRVDRHRPLLHGQRHQGHPGQGRAVHQHAEPAQEERRFQGRRPSA